MRYLYIPKLPEDLKLLRKILSQFHKKSFVSDAKLTVVVENSLLSNRYLRKDSLFNGNITPLAIDELYPEMKTYSKIIDECDIYISASMHSQEYIFTTMAFDKGKDIISARVDDIFEDIPINQEKYQFTEKLKVTIRDLEKDYPFSEWEWMLFSHGLGEAAVFFYYLKKYKEKSKKKLLILAHDQSRIALIEENPYVDQIGLVSWQVYIYIHTCLSKEFHIKDFLFMAISDFALDFYLNQPPQIYPYFVPFVRAFFELEPDTPFEKFPVTISQNKVDHVHKVFKDLNLKQGKTVFINNEGDHYRGFSTTHKDFFLKLIDALYSLMWFSKVSVKFTKV